MSRRMNPDRELIYRAVVEYPGGTDYFLSGTRYYGPYSRRQDAKAALRRENRKWNDPDTPIHPERIEYSWLEWKDDE